jgi:hypothetical protein
MEYITRVEHDEFAKRIHDEDTRQNKRIEKLETDVKNNNNLIVVVERLANSIENMQREIRTQGEKIEIIESRDGQKWRNASWLIVTLIIGGVVGYILKHIGL